MTVPASYYRNLQCPHQHAPWSMPPRNEQFLLLPHTVQTQGEISKECLLLSGSSSNKSSLKSIQSLCTLPVIATSILKPQTSFSELGRLETQGAGRSPRCTISENTGGQPGSASDPWPTGAEQRCWQGPCGETQLLCLAPRLLCGLAFCCVQGSKKGSVGRGVTEKGWHARSLFMHDGSILATRSSQEDHPCQEKRRMTAQLAQHCGSPGTWKGHESPTENTAR